MSVIILSKRKLKSIILLFLIGVLTITCLFTTGAHAVFNGSNLRKLPIYSVEREGKKIAISFDCAWGVDYTDTLLEIMDRENVKCTFFMVEFWTKKYPEFVKKIDMMGHEIGTHSATHPYMSKLGKDAIIKELSSSSKAITDITGKPVEVFRAPYGDYDDLLIDTAKELNLFVIQWDVDSLDWKNLSKEEIENRVLSRVKSGSIVLFHNNGLNTSKALPKIISELKKEGYEFVTIGELIYRTDYRMAVDGRQFSTL